MKKIPYLHILLFVATFATTLAAGALQQGINIFKEPGRIGEGLPFAGTLMTILLFHELSHYIASKKHHMEATLPYFIPSPTLIGTFGAFIKMKSPIVTRRALIDVGASGPISGFIISVIACIIGLSMSKVIPMPTNVEGTLSLGDSILFSFLSKVVLGITPDRYDVLLHPVAFAGWIGLFVTSLNLIPIGQLDGGHIAYAILGERHRYVSMLLVFVLAFLGISAALGNSGWEGWLVWAVLMLILGIKHPPVLYWEVPLDPKRRLIGFISLVIFVITFIPSPFKLIP
ncbi:MAG: site-2 protease family protein [Nitrospirae bacterium]|nr:site-2 protease family protein [Nitrospirota bacterium]MCL5237045.1 site-2 protease family protein [Nitrospirota bacterium]